jgi:hypothetical protein
MKRCICLSILFAILLYTSTESFARSGRLIEQSEVKKVELRMFYTLGKFNGYLVFYDEDANQCAVNIIPKSRRDVGGYYVTDKPRLRIESRSGTSIIDLQITHDRFQVLTLRSGDQIYAYGIDFLPQFEIRKGDKIPFEFISGNLRASTETEI